MESYGHRVSLKHAFKIAYLLNLGRYIPGKIWPVFGMAYLAKKIGIEEGESMSSWIIAQLYANVSSALLCITIAMIEPSIRQYLFENLPESVVLGAVVLIIVASALLLLAPGIVNSIVNFALRLLKRDNVSIHITPSASAKLLMGYVVAWFAYGISFWLLIIGLSDEITVAPLIAIGAFVVAYQAGYLAFFAPGGIGVREFAITVILEPHIGQAAAVGVAIAARLWNMITEIFASLVAYKLPLGIEKQASDNSD